MKTNLPALRYHEDLLTELPRMMVMAERIAFGRQAGKRLAYAYVWGLPPFR